MDLTDKGLIFRPSIDSESTESESPGGWGGDELAVSGGGVAGATVEP